MFKFFIFNQKQYRDFSMKVNIPRTMDVKPVRTEIQLQFFL